MDVEARCRYRRTRVGERRRHVVSIRLSDEELRAVRDAAGSCRLAVGAFVAQCAVSQASRPLPRGGGGARELQVLSDLRDELARTWTAISRVGTNVNQLAKATNATGEVDHARLGPTLAFLRRQLNRVDDTCRQVGRRLP